MLSYLCFLFRGAQDLCQCPTSGFTHFYGTPSKPTFFRYVPTPNLHMFLNQTDFFSFFRPILVFLEILTKSFPTVYLYYTQLSNLMQENFFPPITFEVYHHYTNCTQNTYFASNSIHIFNTYVVFIPSEIRELP